MEFSNILASRCSVHQQAVGGLNRQHLLLQGSESGAVGDSRSSSRLQLYGIRNSETDRGIRSAEGCVAPAQMTVMPEEYAPVPGSEAGDISSDSADNSRTFDAWGERQVCREEPVMSFPANMTEKK